MMIFCIVASTIAIILCSITAIFSFMAYSRVVGMEKSTHQVQWMHVDPKENGPDGEEESPINNYNEAVHKEWKQMYPDLSEEQV